MKSTIISFALICLAGIAVAQKFEKGNVVGSHVGTIVLSPDVTYNQYKSFLLTKYIPELNKAFGGDMVMYFAESDRGTEKNVVHFIYVFKSPEARDKYWPSPEKSSDAYAAVMEKLKTLNEQISKMATYLEKYSNDWVVQ